MPSQESRLYLEELRRRPAFGAVGNEFDLAELRKIMGRRQAPTESSTTCIRTQFCGIACEWVIAHGADPNIRLLYLHGGGFVSGSGAYYLSLAGHISQAAKCAVLLPDYRLAPEHRFPASIEDCMCAYECMLENGPHGPAPAMATFIAGDSAGGNLTIATLLALRDRGRPLPNAGVPISACTDFTLASESMRTEEDPICSVRCMPIFRELYLGESDPCNPLASPVFAPYAGIPPLLIQVGEHEMLRDDSVRVAAKAQADGIQAKLEVWPGMVHVFQARELPESYEAIEHIAQFMHSYMP